VSAKDLMTAFQARVNELIKTSEEAERALGKKTLSSASRDSVVELVHLRATSLMEAFVEDLFFELVLGLSGVAGVVPALTFPTADTARSILVAPGRFPSWLDFEETRVRADPLINENPFSRLQYRAVEKKLLNESTIVRNAIAHDSGTAKSKFEALAKGRAYVARRPADYLLSQRGGQAEGTLALLGMVLIAKALTANSDADAEAFLNPPRLFTSDERIDAGRFECEACSTVLNHPGSQKLGICPTCAPTLRCATCKNTRSSSWRLIV
jgi:hypothetical protein